MGKAIFVGARKGGVGKTMTVASLGIGLARQGKKVLLIDADNQHSLTVCLGTKELNKLPVTLASVIHNIINGRKFDPTDGLIHHTEGIDLLPANESLVGIELALAPLIGRETMLRQYIKKVKPLYDFIIIDTAPTLDLMTINALAASDSVIIPISPKYLDAKGLELLLKSISQIKRQINHALKIDGILLTMVERRATHTQEIINLVENSYGNKIHIFNEYIPRSVRAAEASVMGKSIFKHDSKGKVAIAYTSLVEEVIQNA